MPPDRHARGTEGVWNADAVKQRKALLEAFAKAHVSCARRGIKGAIGTLLRRYGTTALIRQCRALTRSGLFDRDFYILKYKNEMLPNVEPVVDYVLWGADLGRLPNSLFDTVYYLRTNPDVERGRVNPLFHYVEIGEAEGRRPHPLFDPTAYRNAHPELPPARLALVDYLEQVQASPSRKSRRWLTRAWRHWVSSRVAQSAHGKMECAEGRGAGIAFTPHSGATEAASAAQQGRYEWSAHSAYTYIPPAAPADLPDRLAALKARPLISIILAYDGSMPAALERAVRSVRAQWYEAWEIILVDCSGRKFDGPTLECSKERTLVLAQGQEVNLADALNSGLLESRGTYVICLSGGEELTADCLYELALRIDAEQCDVIYSDHDTVSREGVFVAPFFKPDWSPDTLMSFMYLAQATCWRRDLVLQAGSLRSQFGTFAGWDLALRATERAERISHIPKVLFHQHDMPASSSLYEGRGAGRGGAAEALLLDALRRRGVAGRVEVSPDDERRAHVRYQVCGTPLVSIIIPSKNNLQILRACVDSIFNETNYRNYEILIVDNGSTDPDVVQFLDINSREAAFKVVFHPHPFNFSELCNVGACAAVGEILLFLNDDTEIMSADWLEDMVGYAQQEHIGAVGAKLLYPGGESVQHVGVIDIATGPNHAHLGLSRADPGYFYRNSVMYNWIAVTGACLMIERRKFDMIGGFNEAFPVAYNDVDLCYRLLKAGLNNVVCPNVEIIHYESISRGIDHISEEKRERLRRDKQRLDIANPKFFLHDPYYNENLSPIHLDFRCPT